MVGAGGRVHRIGLVLLLLAGIPPAQVQAQIRPFPYALDGRDLVYVPGALGIAYLGHEVSGRVDAVTLDEIAVLSAGNVNGFDRRASENWSLGWQDTSDYLRSTLLVSAALVSLTPPIFGHEWSDAATLGVMSVELFSFVIGVTDITKTLSQRYRPYLYNESLTVEERYDVAGNREGWGRLSHFSGHAASAFAAATFLSKVFSDVYGPSAWSKVVWGASLSTAALVAYARVEGGVHFPTDVLIGAAFGSALGYLVPVLHRSPADSALSVSVAPTGVGIHLTLR